MAGALILADQPTGAGPGVAGEARNDMWKDHAVNLSCPEPGNTSYHWYLLGKPLDSMAELVNPDNPTESFIMDKVGTYRVRLITNGGGPGNTQTRVYRCRFDSAGSLLDRGWALPAVDEQLGEANYDGNERHWSEVWETITEDIRINAFETDILSSAVTTCSNTPMVAGVRYVKQASSVMKLLVVMSTANDAVGSAAIVDLYDRHGVLSGGVPGPVAGSQIDTTTGLPPDGVLVSDPLILSAYEADISDAFIGFTHPGVFEVRLWSEDGVTAVTVAFASLVTVTSLPPPLPE